MIGKASLLLALLAIPAVVACESPAKDKSKASVSAPVSEPAAPSKPSLKLPIEAETSKLSFVGAKVTGKHNGSFQKLSGAIDLVEGDLEASRVTVDIDTASVTTDAEKLTGHLKSADFFDVEKYPKARFVSTKIVKGGEKGATHTVTGNLELHGVTKSITFPATIAQTPEGVTANAEFGINRKDFNIVYPGKAEDLIRDEVLVQLSVKAKKPGA